MNVQDVLNRIAAKVKESGLLGEILKKYLENRGNGEELLKPEVYFDHHWDRLKEERAGYRLKVAVACVVFVACVFTVTFITHDSMKVCSVSMLATMLTFALYWEYKHIFDNQRNLAKHPQATQTDKAKLDVEHTLDLFLIGLVGAVSAWTLNWAVYAVLRKPASISDILFDLWFTESFIAITLVAIIGAYVLHVVVSNQVVTIGLSKFTKFLTTAELIRTLYVLFGGLWGEQALRMSQIVSAHGKTQNFGQQPDASDGGLPEMSQSKNYFGHKGYSGRAGS